MKPEKRIRPFHGFNLEPCKRGKPPRHFRTGGAADRRARKTAEAMKGFLTIPG
jgi:hypothetical protein